MFPFEVDASSNVPPWVQLRQRLVYLIETGYFKPGEQLPTVRGLASEISMNYNTVNKAYISLATDGYIESTRGRGAFVCDLHPEASDVSVREVEMILEDCINACRCLGLSYDEIARSMTRKVAQCKRDELAGAVSAAGAGAGSARSNIVEVSVGGTDDRRAGTGA